MSKQKKKPNILILMSDEHRYDVSGFYGNSVVRTPNLDRLAKDAVVFDNAYTPSPVCIPARQCLAAGQYPRTCKVEGFGQDLTPNYRTFARVFSENGYQTAACGKLHHLGLDQMQGWRYRIAGDTEVDVSYYHRQSGNENVAYRFNSAVKWDDKKEILRAGPGHPVHAREDELAVQGCRNFIYKYFVDSFYDRAKRDEPLMLYVGLQNPHYPYIAEESLFNYYLNRVVPYENTQPSSHPFLGRCSNCPPLIVGQDISERDLKRAMAAYYANIEMIDRQYGEILDDLVNAGENLDDWIIIYTTDHGEMLGEHSIWEKQRFYEGSVRVPLLIRYPAKFKPGRCDRNVNLIDIYATLCELCGLTAPPQVESRSLTGLMAGQSQDWDNETASQYRGKNLMIKRNDLKYHCYLDDQSELLFDLQRDPLENQDFSSDPAYAADMEYFRTRRKDYGF
ncbi:MAG: sulfatase-like hydrolase/transferase [Lachnospiraceae bacterium]|nr:sulfatase-like hydrolase/transferase [Lachnospiraceae bacterium]